MPAHPQDAALQLVAVGFELPHLFFGRVGAERLLRQLRDECIALRALTRQLRRDGRLLLVEGGQLLRRLAVALLLFLPQVE